MSETTGSRPFLLRIDPDSLARLIAVANALRGGNQ